MLSTIMYHYVRQYNNDFTGLKILELENFKSQINYLISNFNILSPNEFFKILKNKLIFPKNSCLLTFDDGYKDHYIDVFPYLKKNNLKAFFFISAQPLIEGKVLDVNKIQFILSKNSNHKNILKKIFDMIDDPNFNKTNYEKNFDQLFKNRYDNRYTILIKNLLQKDLQENLRKKIISYLFKKYVSIDEKEFASDLYMSNSEIKNLHDSGMFIGNHSYSHPWLDKMNYNQQYNEIKRSLDFLQKITGQGIWTMCYPYGSYNADTIRILKNLKCNASFTTKPSTINSIKSLYEIPRLDTNDIHQ